MDYITIHTYIYIYIMYYIRISIKQIEDNTHIWYVLYYIIRIKFQLVLKYCNEMVKEKLLKLLRLNEDLYEQAFNVLKNEFGMINATLLIHNIFG